MIHLDTNFLIGALIPKSIEERRLRGWLRRSEIVTVSAVAWAEFLCGPLSALAIEEVGGTIGEPTPFDAVDAIVAADLFNTGGRRRGSFRDCMIAASALNAGAALATSNIADFQRFASHGLVLEVP